MPAILETERLILRPFRAADAVAASRHVIEKVGFLLSGEEKLYDVTVPLYTLDLS